MALSSISSTAESANAIATDFDAQFINVWIKTKFHIAQSDNDESSRVKSVEYFKLLPGFIQLQELQVFKTNYSKREAYFKSVVASI